MIFLTFLCLLPRLFRAVPEYPVGEGELGQKDALVQVPAMGEIEMAVWLRDAENNTIVGFVSSPFIQRREIMRRPSPLISLFVFKNHIQVLAAFCTTAMLSNPGRILGAVVELHALTIRVW